MKKVSVITRTKNRNILLKRALKSVLSQSHTEWEMIIVNDGGDPGSVNELVSSIEEEARGRIQVLHNPESIGMEAASNLGISRATGEYLVIHDDDDSWTPEFLSISLRELEYQKKRIPSVRGVVSRALRVIEEINQDTVLTHDLEKFRPDVSTGLIPLADLLRENLFAPIQFLYERSVISEIGLYRADLPVLGDWEFNIRFARQYDIAHISDETAFYHHRVTDKSSPYGNSVIADNDRHRFYNQALKNEWLRNDLSSGRISISYFHTTVDNRQQVDVSEILYNTGQLVRYNPFLSLKALERRIRKKLKGK